MQVRKCPFFSHKSLKNGYFKKNQVCLRKTKDDPILSKRFQAETHRFQLIAILATTEIFDNLSEAQLTLRIASQLISATYDKAGTLIDGDAEAVAEVNDVWTFARDLRSRDPNWKLIATESEQ